MHHLRHVRVERWTALGLFYIDIQLFTQLVPGGIELPLLHSAQEKNGNNNNKLMATHCWWYLGDPTTTKQQLYCPCNLVSFRFRY